MCTLACFVDFTLLTTGTPLRILVGGGRKGRKGALGRGREGPVVLWYEVSTANEQLTEVRLKMSVKWVSLFVVSWHNVFTFESPCALLSESKHMLSCISVLEQEKCILQACTLLARFTTTTVSRQLGGKLWRPGKTGEAQKACRTTGQILSRTRILDW